MGRETGALLEVQDITAGYGVTTVLDKLSLRVQPGQVVAMLGANGVGKTTALRVVAGLLAPRAGRVDFRGRRIDRMPAYRVARLGIGQVPEGRGIFPGLSVRENLHLAEFSRPGRRSAGLGSDDVTDLFPVLAQRMKQRGGTLSGGEQQMLAVARALLMRPDLLLLDEPSLGMAPLVVQDLFGALRRIKDSGIAMLIAEQAAHQALTIADFVYVLGAGGRVSFSGTPAQVSESSAIYESYMS